MEKAEARNTGWTRWNGSKLQVGSKCLVQVDFKDNELDDTNNNSFQLHDQRDNNGNPSRSSSRIGKREQIYWHGHIQEMSKDDGPVVVFIEEIGAKRSLPYAALKPLTTRKTKSNNWSLTPCRKNSTYESSL